MTSWTSGYRTDIEYTYGYYAELNPLRAKLAFLNQGLACPNFLAACDLGYGQGLAVNVHAAASTTAWYGTDFNPAHAGFAQELAHAAGSGAKLFDEGFAEFCARPDLPDFDYIGLHGIWTWISDANRTVLVDFIRRKLKVGGVLYISYNTLPGWALFAPMRNLMREHSEVLGTQGLGILDRVTGAMDFAEKLLSTNPSFLRANPSVATRLEQMKAHNRHYIAHEYFNEHFYPMHFSTMAKWLEPTKLQYACSANYLDHIDALNLTSDQQALLAEIPDPMFRQSVRDFMVNQQFRKDYWVKGVRKLSRLEQSEQLRAHRVMLLSHRPDISLKISGSLGEVSLKQDVYDPLLDLMSDFLPRSLAEIETALLPRGFNFNQVLQSVIILVGAGHFASVQNESEIAASVPSTTALNSLFQNKARGSSEVAYLASPVTGGGASVTRFQQLFLASIAQGATTPDEWAHATWQTISKQGHRVVKNGVTLQTVEENLDELKEQARTFAEKRVSALKALQII